MKFTKMHGIGNDYVYINCFEEEVHSPKELAIAMSNRNFGIGADGLILIKQGKNAPFEMDMYNADGSRSEMCGNGLRCVAKYIYDKKMTDQTEFDIETGAGVLKVKISGHNGKAGLVEINMGKPILETKDIPVSGYTGKIINQPLTILERTFHFTAVSMGNPHCVIFLDEDINSFPVEKYGPIIEHHEIFPNRVNVEFVNIISKKEVAQRTWERGTGETLACGTGASAVQVAGVLNNKTDNEIINHLRGGDLYLKWDDSGDIFLKGPAAYSFEGIWLQENK